MPTGIFTILLIVAVFVVGLWVLFKTPKPRG